MLRALPPGKVHKFPQRHVIAIADFVVEIHAGHSIATAGLSETVGNGAVLRCKGAKGTVVIPIFTLSHVPTDQPESAMIPKMNWWERWHAGRWWWRWPLKWLLFAVFCFLVIYPKPWLLPRTISRYADMNAMLDADNPALDPLVAELKSQLVADATPQDALKAVEPIVNAHVPYSWDWDTWGVVEYLPTVDEVFAAGREDCDGRAVVAGSILKRLGFEATLVSDMLHVWVRTPEGSTMSPTSEDTVLAGGREGTSVDLTAGLLSKIARSMSYGVAAFPLLREALIWLALCLLTLHPRVGVWRAISGALLMWIGLDLMRGSGMQAAIWGNWAALLQVYLGLAMMVGGWLVIAIRAANPPRHSASTPSE